MNKPSRVVKITWSGMVQGNGPWVDINEVAEDEITIYVTTGTVLKETPNYLVVAPNLAFTESNPEMCKTNSAISIPKCCILSEQELLTEATLSTSVYEYGHNFQEEASLLVTGITKVLALIDVHTTNPPTGLGECMEVMGQFRKELKKALKISELVAKNGYEGVQIAGFDESLQVDAPYTLSDLLKEQVASQEKEFVE